MSDLLARTQERLESHFAQLAELRGADGVVFALEHGLDRDEWAKLAEVLRAALVVSGLSNAHWLLWVVYAAEHGYSFDGDEYWQSFESDTPYWRTWGSRDQVRTWFRRFQRTFNGIEPKGAWANHFSIICWPVTHAILPGDLQFQFARTLHHARHSLVAAGTTEAKTLGRLVRREAWHASSRFQQFVQQEELVGRLVLAILGAEAAEGGKIILPATLGRIVTDLEKTRQAKEWLESARRAVTRFRGVDTSRPRSSATANSSPPPKPRPPSIRPTLLLRRRGQDAWDVAVNLPTLADLARETEGLREYLLRTRSTVSGGDGTWTPSSWLLGSGREKALVSWPSKGQPLLQFEQALPGLQQLLEAEGTLTAGPVWLCRIREDGTAAEVLGRQVRPNSKYVLLHDGSVEAASSLLTPCQVRCDGVSAHALTLPAALSPTDEAFLAKLNLALCRTVRIWPVGLAARKWDGEGSGEWLTTESPCFAVRHDHALSRLIASLDGGSETVLPAGSPGQTVFLSLPPMRAGEHLLRVRAEGGGVEQRAVEGVVAMTVREPERWVPGTTAHGGMAILADPGSANLADLLNDRLSVAVQGPEGRHVEVTVRSIVPPGDALVRRQFRLPARLNQWASLLGEHGEEEIAASSRAEIAFRGDELGLYRIELERDAPPLRWAVKRHPATLLRLIDEAGNQSPPRITFASFLTPTKVEELDADQYREGVLLEPPGGLFWVHGSEYDDSIVVSVPPQGVQHGFGALGITPRVVPGSPRPRVIDIISGSIIWRNARAIGALAPSRKIQVVQFLDDLVVSLLCGLDWTAGEVGLRSAVLSDDALLKLGERLGGSYEAKGFSAAIRRATPEIATADIDAQSRWFGGVAQRYKFCSDAALAEDAFKLVTSPIKAFGERGERLEDDLQRLTGMPVLLRGARLARFAFAKQAAE